jgi:CDP-diacylglycerol--serine O-phosphatidyltransferase
VPRALWRRRPTTDSPRPAGRGRWTGRLRRGRLVARQVLRVRRRGLAEPYRSHSSRPTRLDPRTASAIPPAGLDALADLAAGVAGPPLPARAPAGAVYLLPGAQTVGRRLRFLAVNACTLAGLSLGLLAILLAMRGEVRGAAACLIACVAFDGLDGMLARRLGVASPFGSQMDSLADMCAFGIAAPVVVYASIVSERSSEATGSAAAGVPPAAAAVACALVAGCAAIRLARFNISPRDSRFFSGVPTTMAAAVLAVAVLIDLPVPPAVQLGGVALLAFAMVSSFPYATLARLLRLPPWLWLAALAGALVDLRLTFVALVAGYLVSGPLLWLHHRRAPVR